MPKRSRSVSPKSSSASDATKPQINVFLFRRDLRVADNTALLQLMRDYPSVPILPAFLFNPVQIDPQRNPYYGAASVRFMMESLQDLNVQLHSRLVLLHGSDEQCLTRLQDHFRIQTVAFNKDYTPFAKERDNALERWCQANGVRTVTSQLDYSLLPLDAVVSGAGTPYAVYTPFYNKCMAQHLKQIAVPAAAPRDVEARLIAASMKEKTLRSLLADEFLDRRLAADVNPMAEVRGGRSHGLHRLETVLPELREYETERNYLSPQRTSILSPYIKFGCVSVREVFASAKAAHGVTSCFVKELFWREFYAMLLFNRPHLCAGQVASNPGANLNLPFQEKFAEFRWSWSEAHWSAFQAGKTGVPLVDAAVRCLNTTGWCHNRNRMVIGSFATKVLFVDWRVCERWYATKAVDYDVASNNGGWQWCSGQGADAMPYFRTFNSFQQAKKFDSDCAFIKKWIPELQGIDTKIIIAWNERGTKQLADKSGYPLPIVDVKDATKRVIEEYGKY